MLQHKKNINIDFLKPYKFTIPSSIQEQQKIATFLKSVDNKISKLERKKNLLEEYKKGVMQKIFSQQIRFKDDNGEDFPDWEEKRLGEFLSAPEKIKEDNIDKRRILSVKLNKKGIEANTNTDTLKIGATIYFKRKKGQFIYGKQNLHNGSLGIIPEKYDGYISSGDIPTLDIDNSLVISDYLIFYMGRKNYYNQLEKYASGSGSKRIHENILLGIQMDIPCVSEQQKIAKFLTNIDKKIEQTNTQLEKTKEFKKGLLQQMFV